MKLILVGGGGHSCCVAEVAMLTGVYSEISYLDKSDTSPLSTYANITYKGNFDQIERLAKDDPDTHVFISVGDNKIRQNIKYSLELPDSSFPNLIHPQSYVSSTAHLGIGNVFMPYSVIHSAARVGDFCIINTSSSIDHHCILNDFTHIAPGAHIAGECIIGTGAMIGIGSSVRQGLVIGQKAIVGAGSAVIRDVLENAIVGGVPAKEIKHQKE